MRFYAELSYFVTNGGYIKFKRVKLNVGSAYSSDTGKAIHFKISWKVRFPVLWGVTHLMWFTGTF